MFTNHGFEVGKPGIESIQLPASCLGSIPLLLRWLVLIYHDPDQGHSHGHQTHPSLQQVVFDAMHDAVARARLRLRAE